MDKTRKHRARMSNTGIEDCPQKKIRLTVCQDTQFHINSLNDDTLLHIFGHIDSLSKCQLLKR